MNQLTGTISTVIFRNDDFLIASLLQKEGKEFVITGSMYGVDKGEKINVQGKWVDHPKYGKQFEVEFWERPIPNTKEQVIAFLSSGIIKGCGPARAKLIVQHLGADAINIMMDKGAASLNGIKGIGVKNAGTIIDSVKNNFEIQKVVGQLGAYGITPKMAIKIFKEFPNNPVEKIRKNPYLLTRLDLVGFLKADEIARRIGVSPTSAFRVETCTDFILKEKCFGLGHCYLPEDELIEHTLKVLNHNQLPDNLVSAKEVRQAIYNLELNKRFVFENGVVFPKFLYDAEKEVAQKLSILRGAREGEAMSMVEKWIKEYQLQSKIVLAEQQREAIRQLFLNNVLILTGGPGTGKSTITKAMINIYQKCFPDHEIGLCAPTGRAARRLSEITGLYALTIHSMLGQTPSGEPHYNNENPLPYRLLIVDEVSMVDIQLANRLLDAISEGTKIIFVGDIDQLPSVNAGNFLKDIISAGLPTVRLTEIFRQAQNSQIVMNAHRVNKGKPIVIDEAKKDFFFLQHEDTEKIAKIIRKSALRFLELGYSIEDILVLSPMKKGIIGTDELNVMLQEALNPPDLSKGEWTIGKTTFREGDKVIHTKNNKSKNIYNGEIGIISRIGEVNDDDGSSQKALFCDFSGREVVYVQEDLKQLQLAYSITIHKSQGGQAPVVITPISTSHYIMLARNLIYTGMTRAEQIMVYVGSKKAMCIAIANDKVSKRNTKLTERIRAIEALKKNASEIAKNWEQDMLVNGQV